MFHANADAECFLHAVPVLQGVAVSTATCVQLHKRAEKIAAALTEKGSINTGENVVLLYPPGGFCLWFSCLSQTQAVGSVFTNSAPPSFPQASI